MSGRSKRSKRGSARRGHLRSVPTGPPREVVVAGQVLDSFTPDFVRWFEQSYGEPEWAMAHLEAVGVLIAASYEFTGACSATVFPAATVRTVLEELRQGNDDEALRGLTECLHVYLDFLVGTGRWSGTTRDFQESHDLVSTGGGPSGELPIEVPDLGEDEEVAAFAELELIRRTTALLSWLDTGRAVTSTGALRLKDVAPAAKTLGVEVRARWNAKRPLQPLPGFEGLAEDEDAEDDGVLVVRSMHEVPVLSTIWPALREAGVIAVGSTTARPAEPARHWLHGSPAQRIEAYRRFTTEFLAAAVEAAASRGPGFWRAVGERTEALVTGVLLAGCTPSPAPRARLESATAGPELSGNLLLDGALRWARAGLDELTELGVLEQGEHYRVPAVVVGCVLAAFGPGDGAAAVEPAAYQLKIALRGAKPPIWRRVLVPSTMRLDDVHDVIQRVFGWENAHLHMFSTGNGYDGARYAPVDPTGMLDVEETEDEAAVPLGALLRAVGDKIAYVYDFGDDWFHDIVLEKVGEPDPAQELPRCIGGRGAGPAEDCGGVWGWAGLVEAVNDPAHPEHEDLREWLGIGPGGTIDPKAFDAADADAALDGLR